MAKRNILKFGDPTLRMTSREVSEITPRIITLLDDMIETMRAAGGCGLAAPQVGVLRRIAVIEVDEGTVYELINPRIISFAGEQREQEGCLSNPGEFGITKRPKVVVVRALNRNGEEYELRGTDLLARAICHECDHLDGKLYTDVQIKRG
ncbi:MAG: peptide deformylase [Clostridia bacterium]|nr:peptide deformylase [Clostridia bacterium]